MTKPTTKSPTERRLRKQIRELLQAHAAGTKTDEIVREFLALIDDEVRRTRMSIAPVVQHDEVSSWYKDAATWVDKPPYLTS